MAVVGSGFRSVGTTRRLCLLSSSACRRRLLPAPPHLQDVCVRPQAPRKAAAPLPRSTKHCPGTLLAQSRLQGREQRPTSCVRGQSASNVAGTLFTNTSHSSSKPLFFQVSGLRWCQALRREVQARRMSTRRACRLHTVQFSLLARTAHIGSDTSNKQAKKRAQQRLLRRPIVAHARCTGAEPCFRHHPVHELGARNTPRVWGHEPRSEACMCRS